MHVDPALNQFIDEQRGRLVETIVDRMFALYPHMQKRYGKLGRVKCIEDTNYHLMFLSEALAASSPELFSDYVSWAKILLAGLNIPTEDFASNLQIISSVLLENAPGEMHSTLTHYIDSGLSQLYALSAPPESRLSGGENYTELAQDYLQALLQTDRQRANQLILDAVQAGTPVKDLYLHVFQRSQYELGHLWHLNEVTIAHEHYCTAATQMIISQLYPYIVSRHKTGRRVIAASVSGELHELGIRMVADFFEMAGWESMFLGANTPITDIVKLLIEYRADVLAVSATMTFHVSRVAALVDAVRNSPRCRSVKIIVGGHPFNIAPDLWEEVGADGHGGNAQEAVDLAERLIADADPVS